MSFGAGATVSESLPSQLRQLAANSSRPLNCCDQLGPVALVKLLVSRNQSNQLIKSNSSILASPTSFQDFLTTHQFCCAGSARSHGDRAPLRNPSHHTATRASSSRVTSVGMKRPIESTMEADPLLGHPRSALTKRSGRRKVYLILSGILLLILLGADLLFTALSRLDGKIGPVSPLPKVRLPGSIRHSWAQYTPYFSFSEYTKPPSKCRITQVNIVSNTKPWPYTPLSLTSVLAPKARR